jgi:hypothetical protein
MGKNGANHRPRTCCSVLALFVFVFDPLLRLKFADMLRVTRMTREFVFGDYFRGIFQGKGMF